MNPHDRTEESPLKGVVQLHCSVPSEAEGQSLADKLVQERVAACVQLSGPGTSTYRWDGKLERSREYYLVAKTTAAHADAAIGLIEEQHSYDCPEVVVTPLIAGSEPYLRWLGEQLG